MLLVDSPVTSAPSGRLLVAFNHWVAYRLAVKLRCPHCGENLACRDRFTDNSGSRYHRECFIRMVAGSAKHQLRKCSCYGFTEEEEPIANGLTIRRWARRAYLVFRTLQTAEAFFSSIDASYRAQQTPPAARDTAFTA